MNASALHFLTDPLFHLWAMPISLGDLSGFATGLACVALAAQGSISGDR